MEKKIIVAAGQLCQAHRPLSCFSSNSNGGVQCAWLCTYYVL